MDKRIRVFLSGVGGQGSLTATTLLAKIALDEGIDSVAGEIHGMAQRGGVVESAILFGGYQSPKLGHAESHLLLGFELVETLRALPYLRKGGIVVSSSQIMAPASVALGKDKLGTAEEMRAKIDAFAGKSYYLPIRDIGVKYGTAQVGNSALLGAACALDLLPFSFDALVKGLERNLPAKQVERNILAAKDGKDLVI